ncbi:MAG: PAS domain-containing protein [Treponema sp.]|nr:PAS domain-containing protein [Treponema sp.]
MIEDPLGVLNVVPMPIGSMDAALRCRFANRAYAEFAGLPQEAMKGMSLRSIWGDTVVDELMPFIKRALAGERVAFTKRISTNRGEAYFGRAELIPDSTGGYVVVIQDLRAYERSVRERDNLIHELDHRVNNILQVLHSVIALETQTAADSIRVVLDAIKSRIDALGISYEFLRDTAPEGGWPVKAVLDKVAASVGPGLAAVAEADEKLRIPEGCVDAFVFIAAEFARWMACHGEVVRIVARRIPAGVELCVHGRGDPTSCAGAAGIALVDSFARSCGAGPLRGGANPSVVFPDAEEKPARWTEVFASESGTCPEPAGEAQGLGSAGPEEPAS